MLNPGLATSRHVAMGKAGARMPFARDILHIGFQLRKTPSDWSRYKRLQMRTWAWGGHAFLRHGRQFRAFKMGVMVPLNRFSGVGERSRGAFPEVTNSWTDFCSH
jgi:hypothetical protein